MKRFQSDSGDSQLVSAIIFIPMLLIALVSIVDVGIHFQDRSVLETAARDGARTVAILGGNGRTPIQAQYGSPAPFDKKSLMKTAEKLPLSSSEVKTVSCTPDKVRVVGDEVECQIVYKYTHVPLSIFYFIDGYDKDALKVAVGTARSEVGYGVR